VRPSAAPPPAREPRGGEPTGADPVDGLLGEGVQDSGGEDRARLVVPQPGGPGPLARRRRQAWIVATMSRIAPVRGASKQSPSVPARSRPSRALTVRTAASLSEPSPGELPDPRWAAASSRSAAARSASSRSYSMAMWRRSSSTLDNSGTLLVELRRNRDPANAQ
jgi:hypothetical protein